MDEGELIMSQRDLHRMHVVQLTLEGRESVQRGADLLRLSARQVKRLRKKMRERGTQGLLHGNRGRRPWNRTVTQAVKKVLQLARGRYQGLNDTHLTEKLTEKEGVKLSRQTIRRLLRQGVSFNNHSSSSNPQEITFDPSYSQLI
jgi:transposase